MKAHVVNEVAINRTARVMQAESLFDVPPSERSHLEWDVDLPLDERPWSIGLIVGPSGAGKSSVARALFGEHVVTTFPWSDDRAIIDDFPAALGIKEIMGLLSSVGFSSPPSWLRPYRALSTGEQFRVSVARALAESDELVVVDEFTSTVDRQVAQVASHTIQKALRRSSRRLVAVTCHYDVIDWLQPDWVYQPATGCFEWRSLQRHPELVLDVCEVDRSAWQVYRRHHYLTNSISTSAKCVVAFAGDVPVAFCAYTHTVHPSPKTRNIRNLHRTVVLPDYQGLGIGIKLSEWVAQMLSEQGYRVRRTLAHPALVAHALRSPRWRCTTSPGQKKQVKSTSTSKSLALRFMDARVLRTYTFEYQPRSAAARE